MTYHGITTTRERKQHFLPNTASQFLYHTICVHGGSTGNGIPLPFFVCTGRIPKVFLHTKASSRPKLSFTSFVSECSESRELFDAIPLIDGDFHRAMVASAPGE